MKPFNRFGKWYHVLVGTLLLCLWLSACGPEPTATPPPPTEVVQVPTDTSTAVPNPVPPTPTATATPGLPEVLGNFQLGFIPYNENARRTQCLTQPACL